MLQLILHAIGDYLIQNDWMALNKKKRTWLGELACQIHCITYSLPFWYFYNWEVALVVYVTHYVIDRTNIIAYFLAIKNGMFKIICHNSFMRYYTLKFDVSNFGFGLDRPPFISIWLYIIVDNIFHIICNYSAINYFK